MKYSRSLLCVNTVMLYWAALQRAVIFELWELLRLCRNERAVKWESFKTVLQNNFPKIITLKEKEGEGTLFLFNSYSSKILRVRL